jgi:hypothetical protein
MWSNDTTEESHRAIKRTKKVHWVIEHIQKQFQRTPVPGKNSCVQAQNNFRKTMKWDIRLFVLAENDTVNVHSIIPNYRKLTGDECNLPYSEKPFISRIVLSLMDRLGLCLVLKTINFLLIRYYSSVELAQELANQKRKYTFCLFTLCPCCINFLGKTGHQVAQQAFNKNT